MNDAIPPSTVASRRAESDSSSQQKPKPVQLALEYSRRVLFELIRIRQTIYFISLRAVDEATLASMTKECADAFETLLGIGSVAPAWFENTRADTCLKSAVSITQEVARLAFRLRRIALNVLSTWVIPFRSGPTPQEQSDQARRLDVFRPFPAGTTPPPRFLEDLLGYLERLNLPELFAVGEMLYIQINGQFMPTDKQRQLHATLRQHGPLTKEKLAEKLMADPSKLYDRWGLSELRGLDYVVSGPGGYSACGDLPPAVSQTNSERVGGPKVTPTFPGHGPKNDSQTVS